MRFTKAIFTAAALPLLMGCGAGGGTGLSFAPVGAGPITVGEIERLATQIQALPDVFDSSSITAATPSVASASYSGFIEADMDNFNIALGRVNLDANFSAGTLSGVAGDFSIFDDSGAEPVVVEVLSGSLPITSGTITGATLSATMNGTLGALAGNYGVTSTLDGGFVDVEGQSLAAGFVSGTMTNPNTSSSTIDGAFLAVQN